MIPEELEKDAKSIGIDIQDSDRAGSYIHLDHTNALSTVKEGYNGKFEMLDIRIAVQKYGWLKDYMWKLVDHDKDEYTKAIDDTGGGYFIWIKKGAKIDIPIQSCMMISERGSEQRVHNIVLVDEGAQANILTACLTHRNNHTSKHLGVSEFYVRKGGYLNFTMIHDWNKDSFVRPRSAASVDEDGHFVSNYIVLSEVKDLQMYPVTRLEGRNSRGTFTSLIYGKGESNLDIGSKIDLLGEDSKAEIISRTINNDNSKVYARGMIVGDNVSKGHLECMGLTLSKSAMMHAVPELVSNNDKAELSHEAAVGMINQQEIIYLMARGLPEEQARSIIVRGFLDINILGLPEGFRNRIQGMIDRLSQEDAM